MPLSETAAPRSVRISRAGRAFPSGLRLRDTQAAWRANKAAGQGLVVAEQACASPRIVHGLPEHRFRSSIPWWRSCGPPRVRVSDVAARGCCCPSSLMSPLDVKRNSSGSRAGFPGPYGWPPSATRHLHWRTSTMTGRFAGRCPPSPRAQDRRTKWRPHSGHA
jgi:hypothetical protein